MGDRSNSKALRPGIMNADQAQRTGTRDGTEDAGDDRKHGCQLWNTSKAVSQCDRDWCCGGLGRHGARELVAAAKPLDDKNARTDADDGTDNQASQHGKQEVLQPAVLAVQRDG